METIELDREKSVRLGKLIEFEQVNEEWSPYKNIDKIKQKYIVEEWKEWTIPGTDKKIQGTQVKHKEISPEDREKIETWENVKKVYNKIRDMYIHGEFGENCPKFEI